MRWSRATSKKDIERRLGAEIIKMELNDCEATLKIYAQVAHLTSFVMCSDVTGSGRSQNRI